MSGTVQDAVDLQCVIGDVVEDDVLPDWEASQPGPILVLPDSHSRMAGQFVAGFRDAIDHLIGSGLVVGSDVLPDAQSTSLNLVRSDGLAMSCVRSLLQSPPAFRLDALGIPIDKLPTVGLIESDLQLLPQFVVSVKPQQLTEHVRPQNHKRLPLNNATLFVERPFLFVGKSRSVHAWIIPRQLLQGESQMAHNPPMADSAVRNPRWDEWWNLLFVLCKQILNFVLSTFRGLPRLCLWANDDFFNRNPACSISNRKRKKTNQTTA